MRRRFKPTAYCPEPLRSLLDIITLTGIYAGDDLVLLDLIPRKAGIKALKYFLNRLLTNFYSVEGYKSRENGIWLVLNEKGAYQLRIPSRFVEYVEMVA